MSNAISGWVVLDKPTGITSAHAVAKVKRLLSSLSSPLVGEGGVGGGGEMDTCPRITPHLNPPPQGGRKYDVKIGHAGTLDPLASGVLPLALGEATKTVAYMMDASKAYEFTVHWGAETETDDLEGKVTQSSDKRPTQAEVLALLPEFTGEIDQTPPSYSAIKVDGQRAYDLARSGEAVELKSRKVRVDSLQLLPLPVRGEGWGGGDAALAQNFTSPLPNPPPQAGEGIESTSFICHCGKGTYIRSLGRDMGRRLGCYGHITRLRRIKVGKFDETQAISLEKLEEMVHKGDLGFMQAVASALDDIPAVPVTRAQALALRRGQHVDLSLSSAKKTVQAIAGGTLVALCEWDGTCIKPVRVFNL